MSRALAVFLIVVGILLNGVGILVIVIAAQQMQRGGMGPLRLVERRFRRALSGRRPGGVRRAGDGAQRAVEFEDQRVDHDRIVEKKRAPEAPVQSLVLPVA